MLKQVNASDRFQDTKQPYMTYAYPGKSLASKFVCKLIVEKNRREKYIIVIRRIIIRKILDVNFDCMRSRFYTK